jgi:polysaccharide export outer membrane protein
MRSSAAFRVVVLVICSCLILGSYAFGQTLVEPQVTPPNQPNAAPTTTGTVQTPRNPRDKLRIGAGDLLEVSVYGVSDFKQEGRVTDSGDLILPLVGAVNVGEMTLEEAQTTIAKALVSGGYFRDPHVAVFIKDYASQGISVMGEVVHPGIYPAVSTRRLFDVVSLAGGFTPKAGRLVTITHRDTPDQPSNVMVTNDPAKSMASNVEVYPGDTVVVSKAGIVYVVGDVARPGGFVMENGEKMTVLQAIAMAQGVNRTAAVGSARLIRRSSGKPEEIKIELKKILGAKSEDVDLLAEDILFIPGSLAKNAVRRGVDSAIQIATSVAIYGIH